MNRRQALVLLSGASAAVGCAGIVTISPRRYGCLTINGWMSHRRLTGEDLHVFLDGEDVTTSCFEADDLKGYAALIVKTPDEYAKRMRQGAVLMSGDRFSVRLGGRVEIRPGAKL